MVAIDPELTPIPPEDFGPAEVAPQDKPLAEPAAGLPATEPSSEGVVVPGALTPDGKPVVARNISMSDSTSGAKTVKAEAEPGAQLQDRVSLDEWPVDVLGLSQSFIKSESFWDNRELLRLIKECSGYPNINSIPLEIREKLTSDLINSHTRFAKTQLELFKSVTSDMNLPNTVEEYRSLIEDYELKLKALQKDAHAIQKLVTPGQADQEQAYVDAFDSISRTLDEKIQDAKKLSDEEIKEHISTGKTYALIAVIVLLTGAALGVIQVYIEVSRSQKKK